MAKADLLKKLQDPACTIGVDEPLFLLRGRDPLAAGVVGAWCDDAGFAAVNPEKIAREHMPLGTSADDLVRHAAFLKAISESSYVDGFFDVLKDFGIDAKKILDQAAPLPKTEAKKATSKKKSAPAKSPKKMKKAA